MNIRLFGVKTEMLETNNFTPLVERA